MRELRAREDDRSRAQSLAILEEHLPGASLPCGTGRRHRYHRNGRGRVTRQRPSGGAASDAAATGAPAAEGRLSRVLAAANQTIIELSVLERDFEEYFVELMGADAEPSSTHAESRR